MEYHDKHRLISNKKDGRTSGNNIRYTCEHVIGKSKEPRVFSILRYRQAIAACEFIPGLMMRNPDNEFGQQGPDDYVPLLSASEYLDPDYPRRFLKHGRKPWFFKYVYNNIKPYKFTRKAWLGRQPQLICHAQFAAGEDPPLWRKLWWVFVIRWAAKFNKPDDQDKWVLSWHLVRTGKGKSKMCDKARKIWIKAFKEKVPGGIGWVLGNYFQNAEHPNAILLFKEYGE